MNTPAFYDEHTPFAVLTDTTCAIYRYRRVERYPIQPDTINSMHDVLTLVNDKKIRYVWVTPHTVLSHKFSSAFIHDERIEIKQQYPHYKHEYHCFLKVWNKTGTAMHMKADTYIMLPEYSDSDDDLWQLNTITSGITLLRVIAYLSMVIPIPLLRTPASSAIKLLEYTLQEDKHKEWLEHSLPDEVRHLCLLVDRVWKIEPSLLPLSQETHLHKYDKNAAYLSAMQAVDIGRGTPVHKITNVFNKSLHGLWKCTMYREHSPYDGKYLPLPYNELSEWQYTSVIQMCMQLGYRVCVSEAWVWEEKHRIFIPLTAILWNGRHQLETRVDIFHDEIARVKAIAIIKTMYTGLSGRFQLSEKQYESVDKWDRADYRGAIIAMSRVKVLAQIEKIRALKHYPLLVINDAIYYPSSCTDGKTAIPTMVERDKENGGYKYVNSVLWDDIAPLFMNKHPNEIATRFNQLARERG